MSEIDYGCIDLEGENFPRWKPLSEHDKKVLDSMRASQEELDKRAEDYKKWRGL